MERRLDHAVSSGEAGKTVGWILDSSLALSARQIRSLKFQPDGILLNGIRVRTDVVVREGDCLSVTFRETGGCLLVPAEGAVFVIYEDEDILAVNKPDVYKRQIQAMRRPWFSKLPFWIRLPSLKKRWRLLCFKRRGRSTG